jgi:thioredoxin 1
MATSENLVHLQDANYEEQISKAAIPVLVDFWAPWCGPCKAIGPVIEELAEAYKDRAVIAKINVDDNQKAALAYGVRSIPTIILFKEGKVVETIIGVVPKARLEDLLNAAIK